MKIDAGFRRALDGAFTTNWPRTARVAGIFIGLAELALVAVPPHQPPDSGLLVFAGALIMAKPAVEGQRRRQQSRQDDEDSSER